MPYTRNDANPIIECALAAIALRSGQSNATHLQLAHRLAVQAARLAEMQHLEPQDAEPQDAPTDEAS